MPQPAVESLTGIIYRKFLQELESHGCLAPEDKAAIKEAISAGTIGTDATVRKIIEAMESSDGENIRS